MLIIGLIIGGLVINLGGAPNHERLGFAYWRNPGAFNEYIMTGSAGQFLAFWKVLLTAAFSFGNVQVVAIAGSETMNPRKVIPAATQKTFLRVFLFYFLSILIVGMIVSVSPLSRVREAFEQLRCHSPVNRILLTLPNKTEDSTIPVSPSPPGPPPNHPSSSPSSAAAFPPYPPSSTA
jgi:amino acid permease